MFKYNFVDCCQIYLYINLTLFRLEVLHRKTTNTKFMEIVLKFNYAFIGLSMYKIGKMFSMYVFWKNKLFQNYQNEHAPSVACQFSALY